MIHAVRFAGATPGPLASLPADSGLRRRMEFAALLRQPTPAPPGQPAVLAGNDTLHAQPVQYAADSVAALPPRGRGEPSKAANEPPVLPPHDRGPSEPPSPFPGFVASNDSRLPHIPRYSQVPAWVQAPLGPYRQAPEEYGGDWWQVNPFTGAEPWRKLDMPIAAPELPEGFERIFGSRPKARDFDSHHDYRIARSRWQTELASFRGTGNPPGLDAAKLEAATAQFKEWGLGEPVFFEDRYGWRVRFPDSEAPDFGGSPYTVVEAPHVLIANYQIRLLKDGQTPSALHPWVPAQLLPQAT